MVFGVDVMWFTLPPIRVILTRLGLLLATQALVLRIFHSQLKPILSVTHVFQGAYFSRFYSTRASSNLPFTTINKNKKCFVLYHLMLNSVVLIMRRLFCVIVCTFSFTFNRWRSVGSSTVCWWGQMCCTTSFAVFWRNSLMSDTSSYRGKGVCLHTLTKQRTSC